MSEYEDLPTRNFTVNMMAGASAGILELCLMYPIDSVKTRMQSLRPQDDQKGVLRVLTGMMREEGWMRPMRGMGIIAATAGPAHAAYFACYEHIKYNLTDRASQPLFFAAGVAGTIATILHDAITNPAEVIKQRLQMADSPYLSIADCAKKTYLNEGLKAFYVSFSTQLAMNIPFQIIHFVTYEMCQDLSNPERKYSPIAHLMSGAFAGGMAAAATTPLDVCKTLLNTQQHQANGMMEAIKQVYAIGGPAGFFKGMTARMLYQAPSNAICWSVFELFRHMLTKSSKPS